MCIMVFWSTYPITRVFRSWYANDRFRSDLFNKSPIPSPTGREIEHVQTFTQEIKEFLRSYFGDPPRTPILELVFDPSDHLFLVRDQTEQIAGTIRYHYIGRLITSNNEPIYVVDAFCIHPKWRKKGVGDYLLTELHRYANERGIPYALFLKEGMPLCIFHQPMYTGWYHYRRLISHREDKRLTDLTIDQAFRIMDIYRSIYPDLILIRNRDSTNQIWKWFRNGIDQILIGIQDTYQRIDQKKMGWITTWIESSAIDDEVRGEAADAVADSIYPTFDYLWINEKWSGSSPRWKRDGAFHWYTYQWNTSLRMNESYGIMM